MDPHLRRNARPRPGAGGDAHREGRPSTSALGEDLLLGDGGRRVDGRHSRALATLGLIRPGASWQRLGVVPVVFGVLGMVLAGLDIRKFVRPPADRNAWWFAHMAGMLGSYIATVSAFSVVNFTFLPVAVRWLWPTAVGTPLIAVWITYYKIRLRRAPSARIETASVN